MMIAFSLRVGWGDLGLEDGLLQSYRNFHSCWITAKLWKFPVVLEQYEAWKLTVVLDPRSVNVRDCVSSQSRTDCDAENLGSATICHRLTTSVGRSVVFQLSFNEF